MKTQLEIERRFLLKCLPYINEHAHFEIFQVYCKSEQHGEFRVREVTNPSANTRQFFFTQKEFISNLTSKETEREISKDEYFYFIKNFGYKKIHKNRWVFKHPETDLKWEVDVFDFKLVIAEIELPTEDTELTLPDFIKRELIIEITEMPEFKNKSLATSYNS